MKKKDPNRIRVTQLDFYETSIDSSAYLGGSKHRPRKGLEVQFM